MESYNLKLPTSFQNYGFNIVIIIEKLSFDLFFQHPMFFFKNCHFSLNFLCKYYMIMLIAWCVVILELKTLLALHSQVFLCIFTTIFL